MTVFLLYFLFNIATLDEIKLMDSKMDLVFTLQSYRETFSPTWYLCLFMRILFYEDDMPLQNFIKRINLLSIN